MDISYSVSSDIPPQDSLNQAYPEGRLCQAYRHDHRRCCKKADIGTNLCKLHTNYYRDWFKNRPPYRGFMRQKDNRVYQSYKAQLKTGWIQVFSQELNSLGDTDYHIDYYLLLCTYCPGVDPLWNPHLFRTTIRFDFLDWIRFPRYEKKFKETLATIATKPEALFQALSLVFEMMMESYVYYITQHEEDIQSRIETILEKLFEFPFVHNLYCSAEWECVFERLEHIIEDERKGTYYTPEEVHWLEHILTSSILPAYKTWHQTQTAVIKSNLHTYVADLMAAAWHPKRVELWIDHFGIGDVFDRM
jgi:hypothetical protein